MGAGKGKARRVSAPRIASLVRGDATGFDASGYIAHYEQHDVAVAKDPIMSSPSEIVGLGELVKEYRLLGENVELRIEAHEPAADVIESYKGKLRVSGTGYLCVGEHVLEDCFEGLWGEHAAVGVHRIDKTAPRPVALELDDLSPVEF